MDDYSSGLSFLLCHKSAQKAFVPYLVTIQLLPWLCRLFVHLGLSDYQARVLWPRFLTLRATPPSLAFACGLFYQLQESPSIPAALTDRAFLNRIRLKGISLWLTWLSLQLQKKVRDLRPFESEVEGGNAQCEVWGGDTSHWGTFLCKNTTQLFLFFFFTLVWVGLGFCLLWYWDKISLCTLGWPQKSETDYWEWRHVPPWPAWSRF